MANTLVTSKILSKVIIKDAVATIKKIYPDIEGQTNELNGCQMLLLYIALNKMGNPFFYEGMGAN